MTDEKNTTPETAKPEPTLTNPVEQSFAEAARLPHAGYKDGRWLGLSYYQLTLQPLPAVPVPPVPLSALGAAETERSLRDAAALCRPAPEVL